MKEEIDLTKVLIFAWNKKFFILSLTSVFALLSILYSLLLPNFYTSSTILLPTESDDSLSSKLSSYSTLANLSGFDIGSENTSKSNEAIMRINSFEFFSNHFLPFVKLENIIAVKKWNSQDGELTYKKSLFDSKAKKWVRKFSHPQTQIPSDQEAFKAFSKKISITKDKKNQFVTISINHQSPIIAKSWIDLIVKNINESMRMDDIRRAENYINFLNESQKSNNIRSLQEGVSKLLENQMQTLMLASSNEDYIFKTIESAIVPEEKSSPNRVLILFLGTFMGALLSMFLIVIQYFREFSDN